MTYLNELWVDPSHAQISEILTFARFRELHLARQLVPQVQLKYDIFDGKFRFNFSNLL